ncbi:unnamed protein product [Caenorhabditis nigoni]
MFEKVKTNWNRLEERYEFLVPSPCILNSRPIDRIGLSRPKLTEQNPQEAKIFGVRQSSEARGSEDLMKMFVNIIEKDMLKNVYNTWNFIKMDIDGDHTKEVLLHIQYQTW